MKKRFTKQVVKAAPKLDGPSLRALRRLGGLSQTQLGRTVGHSQVWISELERGISGARATAADWRRLQAALNELKPHQRKKRRK